MYPRYSYARFIRALLPCLGLTSPGTYRIPRLRLPGGLQWANGEEFKWTGRRSSFLKASFTRSLETTVSEVIERSSAEDARQHLCKLLSRRLCCMRIMLPQPRTNSTTAAQGIGRVVFRLMLACKRHRRTNLEIPFRKLDASAWKLCSHKLQQEDCLSLRVPGPE